MMMRLLLILSLLAPTLAVGQAIEFPYPPAGQVLDAGSWLGDERRSRLESALGRYRKSYQIDVMVVVWERGLPPETSLEDLAERVGETWAREPLWVVILHIPDSLHRPTAVYGGSGTKNFQEEVPAVALHSAVLRGMKERTTRAQVEALGLEAGEEFVFLKNRREFEHKEHLAHHHHQQLQDQEGRHQAMIFRAVIATLLALVAVGVVALLYLRRRWPSDLQFPETRWRRRLGGKWSGGGQIVVALPPKIS